MDKHDGDPKDQPDQEFMDLADNILNDSGKIPTDSNPPPSSKLTINFGPPATTITKTKFSPTQIKNVVLGAQLTDKQFYLNPSQWIFMFNDFHKVKFIYKTDSVMKDGVKCDMNTYKAFTRITIKEMGLGKHFNKQTVDDIITIWMSSEKARFLSEFRTHLSFVPSQVDLVKAWVKAATGAENKLDVAVMRHFIWQVRRKLYGKEVSHHMMPILYGKTGGGKSQAVLQLLKPMDDLYLSMDLSIFSDQFKTRLFTKSFIMFFDEMARSDRADIDKLKNIITSPTVDFRGMHTENLESTPQNCTFIGCSNDLVYDKIYDPTSARRYWQVNCADMLAWKAINNIDYLALWKSVDENGPCPIIPFLAEIHDVQEKKIRHKDLVEDWFETECAPVPYDAKKNPTSAQLYHNFTEWCKAQRINSQPSASKFYRRLEAVVKHLNMNVGPHRTNRGTVYSLQLGTIVGTLGHSVPDLPLKIDEDLENQKRIEAKVDALADKVNKPQK